jgi:3-deoxy-D-manno-octulosonic-acid transferase
LALGLYQTAVDVFFAAGGLRRLKKKYKTGVEERMGIFDSGVPRNALWVHSVSVGEVQSALSLIEAARQSCSRPCVLSTVTRTGRVMAEKLTSHAVERFIYSPWDARRFVRRALDRLCPAAYVAMETERWPTMLSELHRRGIPAFLVNGRLSDESAAPLLKTRGFWRGVLSCFNRLLVRFDSDRENFLRLGVPEEKIVVTGDCKIDAMIRRRENLDLSKWAFLRGEASAPVLLAGSTHPGEEEAVLKAFQILRRKFPRARLVIAPRHPERGQSVAQLASAFGEARLLSGHSEFRDILVVDKIGVLFEMYGVVDAAFVGGSLVPKGGQNLMEPALFGLRPVHGPDMRDFRDADRMDAMGAARQIRDADGLAEAWLSSLEEGSRQKAKEACAAWLETVGGASERSWAVIEEEIRARLNSS